MNHGLHSSLKPSCDCINETVIRLVFGTLWFFVHGSNPRQAEAVIFHLFVLVSVLKKKTVLLLCRGNVPVTPSLYEGAGGFEGEKSVV